MQLPQPFLRQAKKPKSGNINRSGETQRTSTSFAPRADGFSPATKVAFLRGPEDVLAVVYLQAYVAELAADEEEVCQGRRVEVASKLLVGTLPEDLLAAHGEDVALGHFYQATVCRLLNQLPGLLVDQNELGNLLEDDRWHAEEGWAGLVTAGWCRV